MISIKGIGWDLNNTMIRTFGGRRLFFKDDRKKLTYYLVRGEYTAARRVWNNGTLSADEKANFVKEHAKYLYIRGCLGDFMKDVDPATKNEVASYLLSKFNIKAIDGTFWESIKSVSGESFVKALNEIKDGSVRRGISKKMKLISRYISDTEVDRSAEDIEALTQYIKENIKSDKMLNKIWKDIPDENKGKYNDLFGFMLEKDLSTNNKYKAIELWANSPDSLKAKTENLDYFNVFMEAKDRKRYRILGRDYEEGKYRGMHMPRRAAYMLKVWELAGGEVQEKRTEDFIKYIEENKAFKKLDKVKLYSIIMNSSDGKSKLYVFNDFLEKMINDGKPELVDDLYKNVELSLNNDNWNPRRYLEMKKDSPKDIIKVIRESSTDIYTKNKDIVQDVLNKSLTDNVAKFKEIFGECDEAELKKRISNFANIGLTVDGALGFNNKIWNSKIIDMLSKKGESGKRHIEELAEISNPYTKDKIVDRLIEMAESTNEFETLENTMKNFGDKKDYMKHLDNVCDNIKLHETLVKKVKSGTREGKILEEVLCLPKELQIDIAENELNQEKLLEKIHARCDEAIKSEDLDARKNAVLYKKFNISLSEAQKQVEMYERNKGAGATPKSKLMYACLKTITTTESKENLETIYKMDDITPEKIEAINIKQQGIEVDKVGEMVSRSITKGIDSYTNIGGFTEEKEVEVDGVKRNIRVLSKDSNEGMILATVEGNGSSSPFKPDTPHYYDKSNLKKAKTDKNAMLVGYYKSDVKNSKDNDNDHSVPEVEIGNSLSNTPKFIAIFNTEKSTIDRVEEYRKSLPAGRRNIPIILMEDVALEKSDATKPVTRATIGRMANATDPELISRVVRMAKLIEKEKMAPEVEK